MTDSNEILICTPCWAARNELVYEHCCSPRPQTSCECPCVEQRHSDLDTIDLDHDLGMRDLTDPFTGSPW